MEQNIAALEQRSIPMSVAQRVKGLNMAAQLKSKALGLSNDALKNFIKDMRDRFDEHYQENKKFLGVIFYMADIEKDRHDCQFEDLTTKEIFKIVKAINHLKAVSAFLPKNLVLPLN